MKIQEATKRETLHIAAGTLAFSAVMNGVFALLGRWDLTVLWGTLLGGGFADSFQRLDLLLHLISCQFLDVFLFEDPLQFF